MYLICIWQGVGLVAIIKFSTMEAVSLEDWQSRSAMGLQDTRIWVLLMRIPFPRSLHGSESTECQPFHHIFQTVRSRKGRCDVPVEISEAITHSAHLHVSHWLDVSPTAKVSFKKVGKLNFIAGGQVPC